MIFVIDGVDASGKTTLARCMADKLNCTNIHHTYDAGWSHRQLLDHHLEWLFSYSSGENIVLDRSWPSCQVYGSVFRNIDDEIPCKAFRRMFNLMGVCYIFALPERTLWQEKYDTMCSKRDEMYGDDPRMGVVYEAFHHLACDMFMNEQHCYKYDMHRHDMEAFADDKIKVHANA